MTSVALDQDPVPRASHARAACRSTAPSTSVRSSTAVGANPGEVMVGFSSAISSSAHDSDGPPAAADLRVGRDVGDARRRDDGESDADLHGGRRRRRSRSRSATATAPTPAPSPSSARRRPAAPALVRINEVESSGGVPGDWVELINIGGTTADRAATAFATTTTRTDTSSRPGRRWRRAYVVLNERRGVRSSASASAAPIRRVCSIRRARSSISSTGRRRGHDVRPLPERHGRLRQHRARPRARRTVARRRHGRAGGGAAGAGGGAAARRLRGGAAGARRRRGGCGRRAPARRRSSHQRGRIERRRPRRLGRAQQRGARPRSTRLGLSRQRPTHAIDMIPAGT